MEVVFTYKHTEIFHAALVESFMLLDSEVEQQIYVLS